MHKFKSMSKGIIKSYDTAYKLIFQDPPDLEVHINIVYPGKNVGEIRFAQDENTQQVLANIRSAGEDYGGNTNFYIGEPGITDYKLEKDQENLSVSKEKER